MVNSINGIFHICGIVMALFATAGRENGRFVQ
jgi:hypothetical protein